MSHMSRVFLIKAASAISEIAEAAKNKMGMGDSKQYDPRKADINKNGETEAWEKAIAAKRGFKGAPKANKAKADCPCGAPNCECAEEVTKKEAGAVTEAIETVGKKVGGMFSKGKEKGEATGKGVKDMFDSIKPKTRREGAYAGAAAGAVGGSVVGDVLQARKANKKEKEYNRNIQITRQVANNRTREANKRTQEANKRTQEAETKAKKMKERGLIDRVMNKDV